VSVPDAGGIKPITQYFIRDPDGYYLELCNCGILTDFCLGKDTTAIGYSELTHKIDLSMIFKLALYANQSKSDSQLNHELPEAEWAAAAEEDKVAKLLRRSTVYGDLLQGETRESIVDALRRANNHVPRASRIIRSRKTQVMLQPPAFFVQGETRYVPQMVKAPESKNEKKKKIVQTTQTFEIIVRKTFKAFDKSGDGIVSRDELRHLLLSLHQTPDESILDEFLAGAESINLDQFVDIIAKKPPPTEDQFIAFFNLLDIDKNNKVTAPEFCQVAREIGLELEDSEVDNFFLEADLDGDGTCDLSELRNFFLQHPLL